MDDNQGATCPACGGRGTQLVAVDLPVGMTPSEPAPPIVCEKCGGAGVLEESKDRPL